MNAIVIYWSKTGNTEKVARAIHDALRKTQIEATLARVEEAQEVDFFDYDLICVGFPSYRWRPPRPMDDYLNQKFGQYHREGRVKIGAPRLPGKHVLIFCTYSGPHTGIHEAIPAGLYAGQFFDHLGFTVVDEWYVVGEFHGREKHSTQGRLGDIRGRPNENDLRRVKEDTVRLAKALQSDES